jgi:hypothetical protein
MFLRNVGSRTRRNIIDDCSIHYCSLICYVRRLNEFTVSIQTPDEPLLLLELTAKANFNRVTSHSAVAHLTRE